MLEIAALIAGIDRPTENASETERLRAHLKLFTGALTMAQSKADKDERRTAIQQGLQEWTEDFFEPSLARRRDLLDANVRVAPANPPEPDRTTKRRCWARYPVLLGKQ